MDRNGKIKGDARSQHARFVETARALGCDETEGAYDERLKAVGKPKEKPAPKKAEERGGE